MNANGINPRTTSASTPAHLQHNPADSQDLQDAKMWEALCMQQTAANRKLQAQIRNLEERLEVARHYYRTMTQVIGSLEEELETQSAIYQELLQQQTERAEEAERFANMIIAG